ncbi:MAG: cupredoxin domain-containing protein [Candidatus Dormibacteraeota bacterium]|nr:cupredoxin domain-containing protein [Candidatus Dormibacteraeota bacterium]
MRVRSVGVMLLTVGLIAACGGSGGGGGSANNGGNGGSASTSTPGGSSSAGAIKVTMSEFKYDPATIDAKAGNVVINLVNSGTTTHDMVVDDPSGKQVAKSELVSAGASSTFNVGNLTAGSYTVFCDLPGHRQAGMQGTLQVS